MTLVVLPQSVRCESCENLELIIREKEIKSEKKKIKKVSPELRSVPVSPEHSIMLGLYAVATPLFLLLANTLFHHRPRNLARTRLAEPFVGRSLVVQSATQGRTTERAPPETLPQGRPQLGRKLKCLQESRSLCCFFLFLQSLLGAPSPRSLISTLFLCLGGSLASKGPPLAQPEE